MSAKKIDRTSQLTRGETNPGEEGNCGFRGGKLQEGRGKEYRRKEKGTRQESGEEKMGLE